MNKKYWENYYSEKLGIQAPSSYSIKVLNFIKQGESILELGCGNGRDSFYFANKFKDLKINSFEPNIDAYNKFVRTLDKNSFRNIELFKFGLSDKEKKIQTWSLVKNGFVQSNATIVDNNVDLNSKNIKIKDIIVKSGDKIFDFKNKKLCFKIDVEGHEIYTLKGLTNNLNNNK